MSDPLYALQLAVVDALRDSAAVRAIIAARVFDNQSDIPDDPDPYPMITVGDDQRLPTGDHTTTISSVCWVTLELWARGPTGRLTLKQLLGAVCQALDPPTDDQLVLDGHTVLSRRLHSARLLPLPDGRDVKMVVLFRFRTNPIP